MKRDDLRELKKTARRGFKLAIPFATKSLTIKLVGVFPKAGIMFLVYGYGVIGLDWGRENV